MTQCTCQQNHNTSLLIPNSHNFAWKHKIMKHCTSNLSQVDIIGTFIIHVYSIQYCFSYAQKWVFYAQVRKPFHAVKSNASSTSSYGFPPPHTRYIFCHGFPCKYCLLDKLGSCRIYPPRQRCLQHVCRQPTLANNVQNASETSCTR